MVENPAYIILGGTFDPVHNGHILLAKALYSQFKQNVVFMPAATPNYKKPPSTTEIQRLDMLKLAIANNKHFIIDSHEMFETKYIPSVVSLKILREKIGYERTVYFLIGEDSLLSLDTWDNWHELFNLTNFIVALRPGYNLEQMSKTLAHEYNSRLSNLEVTAPYGKIYLLDFKPLDISSTTIRNNIANDLPIENMVDPKVAQYIKDNKLYINNKLC